MLPLVIAHRGASLECPENTLAAFRRALTLKVDGLELDVHVTRDGVPVVFHDPGLRRLTGQAGRIAGRTWRELAGLRVHGLEPIPRLVDVLALTRGRVPVQIEVKAGVPLAPVVAAVRAARAMRWVIFASFSAAIVAACRQLAPRVPRMLISDGKPPPARLCRQLARLEALGLSVDHRAIRAPTWLQPFRAERYRVWCWTVNDAAIARRLAAWGVDALLSDDPALLRRTL